MKRRDLMRRLAKIAKDKGEDLIAVEGGSHTRVQIGETVTYVPRHSEINEITAKAIVRQAGGKV